MEYWTKLSDREQLFVKGGALILGLVVLLQFILMPMFGWRDARVQAAKRAEATYELVREAASRAGRAGTGSTAAASGPIRNVVSQAASDAGVNIVFINQRPDGQVDASASNTAPDAIITWIASLESDAGIRLVTADIAREPGEPGTMRAQLTFSAGD